jgi:CheY-like chemotaxis protein
MALGESDIAASGKPADAAPVTCKILHVNDNDADHQVLAEVLHADRSFSLQRARSGVEALQQLRRKGPLPNLVIINWSFALITCAEFIDQMKSEKRLAVIPIIVIASSITPDEITLAYDAGAACVLRKCLDCESLARTLQALKNFWTLVLLPFCDLPARAVAKDQKTVAKTRRTDTPSKLTAKQRSAIGTKAVQARWAKAKTDSDTHPA